MATLTTLLNNTTGGITPPGSVVAFSNTSAPTGYVKCNGAALSRTLYADLFAAIGTNFGGGDGSTTFNVPDLRGEFIRGWDDSRGVDSGRGFASAQAHAMQSHSHSMRCWYIYGWSYSNAAPASSHWGWGSSNEYSYNSQDGGAMNVTTASENRPRSVALLYCIKF